MKKQFTLLILLLLPFTFMVKSQVVDDTIRTLIISELRFLGFSAYDSPDGFSTIGGGGFNYVELTNVGDEPVNLSEFQVANLKHGNDWGSSNYGYGGNDWGYWTKLPDHVLQPGESYLVANARDYNELEARDDKAYPSFQHAVTWPVIWDNVDFPVHELETENDVDQGVATTVQGPLGPDSVSAFRALFNNWAIYEDMAFLLEHHVGDDSVVVDAVNFNSSDMESINGRQSVAGVPMAAFREHLLVRKTNVTQGNTDWEEARGASLEDAEWIPVPARRNWRDANKRYFTTLKVHEDATLDENSFKPAEGSAVEIDWTNNTITAPWGIYIDYFMDEFELGNNIAWDYTLNDGSEKNMYNTVADGDTLIMYALGNELEEEVFTINVTDAPADLAEVFPLNKKGEVEMRTVRYYSEDGGWSDFMEAIPGSEWKTPYWVSLNNEVIDTIGNLPFALRTDSLVKYLEKAPNASWEFVWVDGMTRADLKFGDILKVTAEDGTTTHEYFLDVAENPEPSHNAHLSAITWPDAPSFLRQSPDWKEDTIPGFNSDRYGYRITLPYGTTTVPALVAHTEDINAQISVQRATQVKGDADDRTTVFTVAAEDDTTILEYSVQFVVEVRPEDVQPHHADPIFTQFTKRMKNRFNLLEISNPGNRPVDLSEYMVVIRRENNQSLAEMITREATEESHANWGKYLRYVPGYMYAPDSLYETGQWGYLQKDLQTNPVVKGGESFVIGAIRGGSAEEKQYAATLMDVIVTRGDHTEDLPDYQGRYIDTESSAQIMHFWQGTYAWALLKIKNDSVTAGTKRVGDPADYELIDLFGDYVGEAKWHATGDTNSRHGWMVWRKPDFWQGDTLPGYEGSWAPTPEESEWIKMRDRNIWLPGWGSHEFAEITVYQSTVNSYLYAVSDGFENYQSIHGVVTGTSAGDFMSNILKFNQDQELMVKHRADGDELMNNDTLVVTSANGENTTEYVISVGEGLSDDATLTAKAGSGYTVNVDGATGTITGVPFGANIEEVLSNVTKPSGAKLNIIDDTDKVIPLQVKNNEGLYVKTQASSDVYFEVVSENNQNVITYHLEIAVNDNAAIAVSDIYNVDQDIKLISLIRQGVNVKTFMDNVSVNQGASAKIVDKLGNERIIGEVAFDDRLVVTSPDETVTKEYFLLFMEESLSSEAWVVSDVLNVNQIDKAIAGIGKNTSKNVFEGLLEVAPRASITLLDSLGNVVDATDAVIETGYMLQVVSGDGQTETMYRLVVTQDPVSVAGLQLSTIKAYPNPATDRLVIEGLEEGSQIIITDLTGMVVKKVNSSNYYRSAIAIDDLPKGIYLLNAQKGKVKSNTVRFIKQ